MREALTKAVEGKAEDNAALIDAITLAEIAKVEEWALVATAREHVKRNTEAQEWEKTKALFVPPLPDIPTPTFDFDEESSKWRKDYEALVRKGLAPELPEKWPSFDYFNNSTLGCLGCNEKADEGEDVGSAVPN